MWLAFLQPREGIREFEVVPELDTYLRSRGLDGVSDDERTRMLATLPTACRRHRDNTRPPEDLHNGRCP